MKQVCIYCDKAAITLAIRRVDVITRPVSIPVCEEHKDAPPRREMKFGV